MNLIAFQDIVKLSDGRPVTDSLKVAQRFGKAHKTVLRSVDAMRGSANESIKEFWRHNFAPPETPTRAGRRAIPHRVRNWTERDPHTRGKKGAPSSNAGYSRITPTRTRAQIQI